MDANQVADLLGTLATAGLVALFAVSAVAILDRPRFDALRALVVGSGAALAGTVAVVATAGSLWFSEVADFPPCRLCWFQRIAMYPLALLLPIAAARRDRSLHLYARVLALVGGLISAFHVLLEVDPSVGSGGCEALNPCSIRWVEGLGFWTIPRMAAVAFALVFTILTLDRPASPPLSVDPAAVGHASARPDEPADQGANCA